MSKETSKARNSRRIFDLHQVIDSALQEAMFPLQKCSEILRVVPNLHGWEKYLVALHEKHDV